VLVRGRKVAGLLCERIHRVDLIGLGVNVNLEVGKAPGELAARIASMRWAAGRRFDMTDVLIAITSHLRRISSRRDEVGFGALLKEYDRHHALVGREIGVTFSADEPEVRGRCEGLDEAGRLLLREAASGKVHRIIAGHVEME
jgi:biotin-(acetyl-CoA carboxylase) ligase